MEPEEQDLIEPEPGETDAGGPDEPRLNWTLSVDREQRSVFELKRLHDRGELVLNPAFQRQEVWPLASKIRLVESVLLRLPLPAVYFAEESAGGVDVMEVIDGRQRLGALFGYVRGEFRLSGLASLTGEDFRGKFAELDTRFQRRIEDFQLSVVVLRRGTDPDVKFHVFERLNRGGVALNAQEIRNGIFRGPGLAAVNEIANDFRSMFGKPGRTWNRMIAEELVLRAFAFATPKLLPYPGGMAVHLNKSLRTMNGWSEASVAEAAGNLVGTLLTIEDVLGRYALHRVLPDGRRSPQINAALLDALVYGFSRAIESPGLDAIMASKSRIQESLARAFTDPEFQEALTLGTNDVRRVGYRTNVWDREVQRALTVQP